MASNKVKQSSHRQQGDAERIAAGNRIAVERVAIVLRGRFDQTYVIGAVSVFDIGAGRRPGRSELKHLFIKSAGQVEQRLNTFGTFGMRLAGQMF